MHKLNTRKGIVGWLVFQIAAILVTSGFTSGARAADPSFVGALAIAVEEGVAERLGLSDEVKAKLVELINLREDQALEIVLANKDLPPVEQTARLVPFVIESERLGFALLTVTQREKLQHIRLARQGMSSLGEPGVAQSVGLSEKQQATVKQLLEQRAVDLTKGGESERRITRAIYERKLAAVLSDQQKSNWQTLAGQSDAELTAVSADVPERQEDADESQPAAGEQTDTETPAVDEGTPAAVDSSEGPAMTAEETRPTETPEEKTEPAAEPAEGAAEAETAPSEEPAAADSDETAKEGGMTPEDATEGESEAADTQPEEAVAEAESEALPSELRFNFDAAPWKDVLKWFADTAHLSLDAEEIPLGTFTYRDDRVYTVEEAIDLLNSSLLTRGFTLIRRDRMLKVLNYEGEIPPELVTLVNVEDLDKRGKYEYVKCLFPLARMTAKDAADMVDPFLAPYGQVVPFPNARQILVVETGGKLRAIRDMIARVEKPEGDAGSVAEVKLENISAEEFLTIARSLLGLAEGENSGEGLSIAIAPDAKTMYVTGEPGKLALIHDLVPLLDKKAETTEEGKEPEKLELRTYFIKAADPEVVLRVLQTLLADMPGVRMEMDVTSGKLVALAYPAEHKTIEETIQKLEGQAKDFKVIQLKQLDPELAVAAVNKFFGLVASDDKEEAANPDAPVVDGDPITMQMWVRGTAAQIEQIEDLVTKLEEPLLKKNSGGNVRMIPLTGADAITAVENAQLLWGRENKIRMVTPSALTPSRIHLRTITPLDDEPAESPGEPGEPGGLRGLEPFLDRPGAGVLQPSPGMPVGPPAKDAGQAPDRPASKEPPVDKSAARWPGGARFQFASQPAASEPVAPAEPAQPAESPSKTSAPEIRVAITPGGIFIASDDLEALDEFEKRLRDVSGPASLAPQRDITVFYLKYAKAEVAHALLQEILGGHVDESSSSLLGDVTTNLLGGGLLGGLLGGLAGGGGGGGGDDVTTIQATGMVSIVADPRLNALVVEANPTDLKLIEELLKVIDRESSETDIQTAGTPYPIVVKYASADEVANVVREVFADRIATTSNRGRQQPSPEDFIRALRGQRGGQNQQSRGEAQKMTIGVDLRTNSIIVVAPEPLYRQVEALVQLIDQPGLPDTDYIEVVGMPNAKVIAETLENVIAQKAITSQRTSSSGQSSGGGQPSGPTPDQIRQRMEMFQRLRSSGAFGRPGGGAPGGFGGFRPGGGGPSSRGGGSGRGGPSGRGGR